MRVKTELVRELLVGRIVEAALARLEDPLPQQTRRRLEHAARESGPARQQANGLAHAGYLARVVELELFEPARASSPQLAAQLAARLSTGAEEDEAIAGVAGELARTEPPGRPDPGDPRAASWTIPGPGGHVRHYAALQTAERLAEDGGYLLSAGDSPAALKRYWLCGFFTRCCEDEGRRS